MGKSKLLYTTGSPFSRIVRIVLSELSLKYEHLEEITTPSVDSRSQSSPTLQVPTFWDDDVHLWESGLIVEYLLANYKAPVRTKYPLAGSVSRSESHWEDKLVLSSIHTLGTSATIIGQMKWGGVSIADSAYLEVCSDRIKHLLRWLEAQIFNVGEGFIPSVLSSQDIALACHLGYILNRPIGIDLHIDEYPRIQSLLTRLNDRDSFINNPILWWEPGVVGYEEDGCTPIYE